jgi:hypothetical protein
MLEGLDGRHSDDGLSDIPLKFNNVLVSTLIGFGLYLAAIGGVVKLGIKTHPVTGFLKAALQDVAHSLFLPGIVNIFRFAFV